MSLDPDKDSSSDESDFDVNEDSEGWDDVEPDEEEISVKDLFSDATFPSARLMLENCKKQHQFDFEGIVRELDLDFLGAVKLVNYLRSEVQAGRRPETRLSKEVFEKDQFIQPTLEDDALLFSLDDVLQSCVNANGSTVNGHSGADQGSAKHAQELQQRLDELQAQFEQYRLDVARTLDQRWNDKPLAGSSGSAAADASLGQLNEELGIRDDEGRDKDYFTSYSYADIHETMLKDAVRTDAYRDFIYDNKHLFKDKVVLDVGCGTGILSMFCAKAGAARVIAVDNSDIISKTRSIIAANNFSGVISCVKGKIEEIVLPHGIKQVDVIVSEWMGYCLLFEAMLDSVLYARDRYLKPDGLMVPSHCTLHAGLLADEQLVGEHFAFWQDVYGFDMSAMSDRIHDQVFMRHPGAAAIAGRTKAKDGLMVGAAFKVLDLHTVSVADLEFSVPLDLILDRDVDRLDGFCLWFDTIFLTDRSRDVPIPLLRGLTDDERAEAVAEAGGRHGYFSTGPFTEATHWQCGLCVVEQRAGSSKKLAAGQEVRGTIRFRKTKGDKRALKIKITWDAPGSEERGEQKWLLG